MQDFRQTVNDCMRIGLANGISSLKRLSLLSYRNLKGYHLPSYYKLCAISKAVGILASRRKSIRRGYPTRDPYMKKPIITSCYGFKVEDGILKIPLGDKHFEEIPLNGHTLKVLSDAKLRVDSFTLTDRALSLCISKEIEEMKEVTSTMGGEAVKGNVEEPLILGVDAPKLGSEDAVSRRLNRTLISIGFSTPLEGSPLTPSMPPPLLRGFHVVFPCIPISIVEALSNRYLSQYR